MPTWNEHAPRKTSVSPKYIGSQYRNIGLLFIAGIKIHGFQQKFWPVDMHATLQV
jgi:hypothetical protein